MDTIVTPAQAQNRREPIPGYTLTEKIGAGGYGEVWKADAPGGLIKAVKIVFGQMDGPRAERELKSLNRMKQVQHPFLLSLERIEFSDGQLVIVTELAEGSLQDRFEQCQQESLPGIPRDELLGYMRDTADALDFLYESQGLQHLDVKPENLLLLSRHIKVADFGLAKYVDELDGSMIGGLTPLYAPPEMFDGRPNRHSDQYSLAIVYQHMLTGEPPFGGRTTAQLAAQHLRSKPILTALPDLDQAAVARALAKNPEKRFSNCRAFVDALSSGEATGTVRVRRTRRSEPRVLGAATQVLGNRQPAATGHPEDGYDFGAPEQQHVTQLPALPLGEEVVTGCRPTIVIGLGSTAAETLRLLRGRLSDRFGDLDLVPTFQLLAIDTDIDALSNLTIGEDRAVLKPRETVAMPLCDPQEYRGKSKSLLEWMNRRWLYNIPRTLKTEGIRPLGRLAFVDNFEGIRERLRCAVAAATSEDSLRQASAATGIEFTAEAPRVFVVSCISGGTGSGAVIDLSFALRGVMSEMGVSDEHLIGLLLHSTCPRASARDLAICNTIACLSELNYFAGTEGFYPGEPACGIEAFREDSAPFRQLYLVHLGDELSQEGFEQGAAQVAEYLYRSTATTASVFFDRARRPVEISESNHELQLRTFGLARVRDALADAGRAGGEALCRALVKRWIGGDDAVRAERTVRLSDMKALVAAQSAQQQGLDPVISQRASEFAASLELGRENLLILAIENVARELRSPEEYLHRLVNETRERLGCLDHPAAHPEATEAVLETIDGILVGSSERPGDHQHETLQSVLDLRLAQSVDVKIVALQDWLLKGVNDPNWRLYGANQAASWFRDHIESIREESQRVRDRLEQQAEVLERRLKEGTSPPMGTKKSEDTDPRGDAAFLKYAQLRFEQAIHRSIMFALRALNVALYETIDQLDSVRGRLAEQARLLDESGPRDELPVTGLADLSILGEHLRQVVSNFDREVQQQFFGGRVQLATLSEVSQDQLQALFGAIRERARDYITRILCALKLDAKLGSSDQADITEPSRLEQLLAEATPRRLTEWGGATRLLLAGPAAASAKLEIVQQKVQRISDHESNIVTDTNGDLAVCFEVQQIGVPAVVHSLIGHRADYLEIAERLHCRIDIEWPALQL